MQPLLFGIDISTSATAGADPVRDALRAEALGFDFVSASDHPSGSHPSFETWTMLTWIAAATSRISVASRVLSVPFRSPTLVAKMAESLDRLSAGRLILGLGAGATDHELNAFGLPVPSAREKIDGLDDALQVIRGLWTQSVHSYEGPVHHTIEAMMEPKPAHRIPVWLGTFGDRAPRDHREARRRLDSFLRACIVRPAPRHAPQDARGGRVRRPQARGDPVCAQRRDRLRRAS